MPSRDSEGGVVSEHSIGGLEGLAVWVDSLLVLEGVEGRVLHESVGGFGIERAVFLTQLLEQRLGGARRVAAVGSDDFGEHVLRVDPESAEHGPKLFERVDAHVEEIGPGNAFGARLFDGTLLPGSDEAHHHLLVGAGQLRFAIDPLGLDGILLPWHGGRADLTSFERFLVDRVTAPRSEPDGQRYLMDRLSNPANC